MVFKVNLALKAIDKKNVVVDPKKAVGKTPDPKKPPPPQPKVEPKKKPDSKLTAGYLF
jgi:hypothetical protein